MPPVPPIPAPRSSAALPRFACVTAAFTLALIGLGGLVTSHGVGMAVPDWPTTYGYNMFFFPISQWVGGIFYEHTHRLLASGVGLLMAILALWVRGVKARPLLRWGGGVLLLAAATRPWWLPADRHQTSLSLGLVGAVALAAGFVWPRCAPASRGVRWLGVAAFFGVVLQGVLGGLRVVLFKDQIGIVHAALAQLFLVAVTLLAVFLSPRWENWLAGGVRWSSPRAAYLRRLFPVITGLIFLQLVVGATMRHEHAGLAIPDFPLAYHQLWPALDSASIAGYNANRVEIVALNPITANQILLQLLHRFLAVTIFVLIVHAALRTRHLGAGHPLRRLARFWLVLVHLQFALGAFTIWSNKAADVATAHVVVGALCLVTGALLTTLAFRGLIPVRVAARSAAAGPVAAGPAVASNPN